MAANAKFSALQPSKVKIEKKKNLMASASKYNILPLIVKTTQSCESGWIGMLEYAFVKSITQKTQSDRMFNLSVRTSAGCWPASFMTLRCFNDLHPPFVFLSGKMGEVHGEI